MRTLFTLFLTLAVSLAPAPAQIAGRNINMVSGTAWPDGDPFLQRQNEPSIAVSSRNPLHILAAANDYRTVDLPGLAAGETGDAWLGVFKSYDGGQSWRSTLHPGCRQSVPQCAGAPALTAFSAGADPVVRAGTNGLFYYSGIAFDRTDKSKSVVFVSRFIDNNNEENGDPIKYAGTVPVMLGNGTQFVDKPWLAVDIPRQGAGTCTVSSPQPNGPPLTQTFAAGNVYVAFTAFAHEDQPPSRILFARSLDCGATWSTPATLTDAGLNQAATMAVDPSSGTVWVAWRRFSAAGLGDAILVVKSTDGGATFSAPAQVAAITPFDQGTSGFSFRTNAYPTMTVDAGGRVYVAWAERGFGMSGDARVVITTSRDGRTWTRRTPVSDFPARGHQFMPAMTFGGGTLMVIFYDLRQDNTIGVYTASGRGEYTETRAPAGDLATSPPRPEKVYTPWVLDAAPDYLNEGGLLRRHTVDLWAAQANPGDSPYFTTARLSQYVFGSRPGNTTIEQLQVNPPNFPLFEQGTAPFFGDYLDVTAAPSIVPGSQPGTWQFNTDPSRSIVFHAAWTDNRDVRPPANGDWTSYTPPFSASTSSHSLFDPSRAQPACQAGQTGMRNQNIYTARITQGLTLSSPSNAKTLGKIKRVFPVVIRNTTAQDRYFRLTLHQPAHGRASFLQFKVPGQPDPLTTLDVAAAAGSSVTRTVFVDSKRAADNVEVDVAEISAPGAEDALPGGLQGSIQLNPDPLNPDNPAISSAELFNPDIANPDIANPDIANPDIANPDIANPDIANPDIANPDIANLGAATPDIANPDIANPDIANPDIENPDIENPDIANVSISDATWDVTNRGSATGSYNLLFVTEASIPSYVRPQLIVHRTYTTPAAVGCALVEERHTLVATSISNPPFLTHDMLRAITGGLAAPLNGRESVTPAPGDGEHNTNPSTPPTAVVRPGEVVHVTLRFYNLKKGQPLGFDPANDITVVALAQQANTGNAKPTLAASRLTVATGSLPDTTAGSSYSAALLTAGGTPPYAWSLVTGALPPGLSLGTDGTIAGVVAGWAGGTYNFTVQVADSSRNGGPPSKQKLAIQVSKGN